MLLRNLRAITLYFYGAIVSVYTICRAISVTIDSDLFFGYFAVVHPNTVAYPQPFWLEFLKILALKKHEWKSFDETKIRDQRRRIAKGCAVYLTLSLLPFGRSLIVIPLGVRTLIVFFLFSAGWATNVPCEETKGNRLPLPFMGKVPKAYPSYSDILSAQLGGESFSSMNASEENNGRVEDSPNDETGALSDGAAAKEPVDCSTDDRST